MPGVANTVDFTVTTSDPCAQYYGKGYCTDYIRTKVNIPWRGDPITWIEQARKHSYKTGNEPKVSSIAVFSYAMPFGHVAWVESILPDGSFTVSHWNWGKMINRECGVTEMFGKTTTKIFNKNDSQLRGFIYP